MTEESDLFVCSFQLAGVGLHVLDCGQKRLPAGRKYFSDGVFLLFRRPEICYHTQ